MRMCLIKEGNWNAIESDETETVMESLRKKRDQQALASIALSLEPHVQSHIEQCKTAIDA